jgi:phosphatidylglycerol:prolipoprotein diacylglycerol transferase
VKPLIPYFQIPVFHIPLPVTIMGHDSVAVHGFGMLVAIGFLLGGWLAMKRAERIGLDKDRINQLIGWLVVGTFIGGHVGYGLMYKPAEYLADPSQFLNVTSGLSSFGGFVVCVPLCVYFFRKHKMPVWANLDCVAFGFSFGWFFGRLGCTVAHDHPGTATNFFLAKYCRPVEGHTLALPEWAVQGGYDLRWGPCRDEGGTAILNIADKVSVDYSGVLAAHDMGFYEALLSLATLLVFLWLDRKPRVPGLYPLLIGLTYGPARFIMDSFRPESTDHTDFFFTPGQWGSIAVFLLCGYLLRQRLKSGDAPVWAPPGTKPASSEPDAKSTA